MDDGASASSIVDNDNDNDNDNASNVSEEANASLVGFGEGASTISGPISRPNLNRVSSGGGARTPSSLSSPSMNNTSRVNPLAAHLQANTGSDSPVVAVPSPSPLPMSPSGSSDQPGMAVDDPRLLDGMTYDADVVDTTMRTPRLASFQRGGSQQDTGSGSTGSSEPGR